MRNQNYWKIATIVLFSALVVVLARDKEVPLTALPPEAAATLKRLFPDFNIASVREDREHGETILKVRLNGEDARKTVLAKVTDEGELIDLDEDLEISQIPPHILKACRKGFPDAEILHAERGTEMEITYRFDIVKNNKKHEIKISRRGKLCEVESRD